MTTILNRSNIFSINSIKYYAYLLLAIIIITIIPCIEVSALHIQEYVIAWSDVGPPHPFTGYPFGPIYTVASLMLDQLAWYDKDRIIPLLAESWESPDGIKWIVKLRKGVKWHDGKEFTADDVIFSINYTKYVNSYVIPLWWARWWTGFTIDVVGSIRKIDNYTVEFLLNTKVPEDLFIGRILTSQFIVPEHVWRGILDPRNYTDPKAYIGTGPYKFVKYDRGREYVFIANEDYYIGKPSVRTLRLVIIPPAQLIAMMKRGEVHAASFSSYDDAQPLLGDSMFSYLSYGPGFTYALVFNHNKYPFNSTAFRRAIAYAINYSEIFERLGGREAGWPGEGPNPVPPYSPYYYAGSAKYSYNLDRAVSILESIGFKRSGTSLLYPDGSKVSLSLIVPSGDVRAQTISILVKKYLEDLGVIVEVKSIEAGRRADFLAKGDFDIMINFFGGMLSPYSAGFFEKGSVHYIPGYNSFKLLQIMSQAQLSSYDKRVELMRSFQEVFAEEIPMLVFFWPKFYWVFNRQAGVSEWFFEPRYEYGPPWILNKLVLLERQQHTVTSPFIQTTPTPMVSPTTHIITSIQTQTIGIFSMAIVVAIAAAIVAVTTVLLLRLRGRR
jgi:peptide/nickel transport system substrate-binding protein